LLIKLGIVCVFLCGVHLENYAQTEDKCPWCQADEVFKGKTVRREIYAPLVDKTFYLIEIPLENADGTLSKLSIYRDITKRKNLEKTGFQSRIRLEK